MALATTRGVNSKNVGSLLARQGIFIAFVAFLIGFGVFSERLFEGLCFFHGQFTG